MHVGFCSTCNFAHHCPMQRLYEARDSLEAQMLLDYLGSYHIHAEVLGNYLNGAAGELSAMNFPVLWIMDDEDHVRATELLQVFLQRPQLAPVAGPWICASCEAEIDGGFELCWQCGKARA